MKFRLYAGLCSILGAVAGIASCAVAVGINLFQTGEFYRNFDSLGVGWFYFVPLFLFSAFLLGGCNEVVYNRNKTVIVSFINVIVAFYINIALIMILRGKLNWAYYGTLLEFCCPVISYISAYLLYFKISMMVNRMKIRPKDHF